MVECKPTKFEIRVQFPTTIVELQVDAREWINWAGETLRKNTRNRIKTGVEFR